MFSRIVLLLFSVLLMGQNVSSKRYTVEMFIDDTSFVPGLRPFLTLAYNSWSLFTELKGMASANSSETNRHLEEIDLKLDIIESELKGLAVELHQVSDKIGVLQATIADKVEIDQPSQNLLYNHLEDFHKHVRGVNRLYEIMHELNQTNYVLEESTYETFVEKILDPSQDQLLSMLDAIHDALTRDNGVLEILTKKHLTNTLVCRDEVSPLYIISNLYRDSMKAFMKAVVLHHYAYGYRQKEMNKPDSFKGELELSIRRFYSRTFDIVETIKIYMNRASAAYWKCSAVDLHENVTYAKLGPIFQKYLLREQDAKDKHTKCMSSCEDRKDVTIMDKCESNFCKDQTRCSGFLVNCQKSYHHLNICLAEIGSGRRYNYIEGKDKNDRVYEVFGKKNTCRKLITARQRDWKFFGCEYCQCTCLSHTNIVDIDRYFSLRQVTSDINNNKVVTGVRFVKENHVFHIQIEEGTLLENAIIDEHSTAWKSVDYFSIHDEDVIYAVDYHIIEWNRRTVHLDDLKSNGDNILTGLRFKTVGDALQLEIQVTKFDFNTGKLDVSQSAWITSDNKSKRTELDMNERDLPESNTYRHLDSSDNQFLKFTTSSFKDDVGQTVVPYIDLGSITTSIRTPLSGAGLMHQANTPQSAGFLSFKLFNYNYVDHLGKK